MRQSRAFAQGYSTTSTPTAFETALEQEIQEQSLYLANGRDVVRKITEDLPDFLLSHSKAESRKVVVPIDANIFLSTNATRRLTPESTDLAEEGSDPDGRAAGENIESDKPDPKTTTVMPVKHALDLQSNIAALLAIMFITNKPFLYATTIDHVTDIITARASHEGCSDEGLSVLNSMGEYGNGICIAFPLDRGPW
jgi:hypothetical protein